VAVGADLDRVRTPGTGTALLHREDAPVDLTELVPAPRREIGSFVPDRDGHLDVRLHAPSPETVIVRVDGPMHLHNSALMEIRIRQQFGRAPHVILDLSAVTWMDLEVARELRDLLAKAESCGTRLHIAAENEAVVEGFRRVDMGRQIVIGSADAVLASLASSNG
jgi:anti-anti-sigma regulatory factor